VVILANKRLRIGVDTLAKVVRLVRGPGHGQTSQRLVDPVARTQLWWCRGRDLATFLQQLQTRALRQETTDIVIAKRVTERGAFCLPLWRFSCLASLIGVTDIPVAHGSTIQVDPRRMIQQRRFKRMTIDVLTDGTHLLHLGEMEIWDGADLALLREGLTQLIERDQCRSIVVDMQFVKYIPSGFFGMLFDWYEKRGTVFALTTPQPNVQRMLWFQQFFRQNSEGWHELHPEGRDVMTVAGVGSLAPLPQPVDLQ
jgi:anti-anti-sigma regulatory factor